MFTESTFSPLPFGKITQTTHDEHKKLYAGYVKNANSVLEKLASYQKDETRMYETGELYRRFAFEYNGMRNHEVYFALLSGTNTAAPALFSAIKKQWDTLETFTSLFSTLALTRGIGWAMLSYDRNTDALIMHWIDEQQIGQLQSAAPIIALDMWEHSFVADYQPSGKKQYIEDFFKNLNWSLAEALYQAARGTK